MSRISSATEKPSSLIEFSQGLNGKTPVLSSRQLDWNGILVEQYQYSLTPGRKELPALSQHWLILPLGHPVHLNQKADNRWHKSIFQKGNSLLVPAEQSGTWSCRGDGSSQKELHIRLQPELVKQVAEAAEIDATRLDLVNRFAQLDSQLHHIAMLLLAELRSDGIMGQLYVESLTQVLAIHLLRHYSEPAPTITSGNRSLTHAQLQQAIDYIHTHLDQDLSLNQIANVVYISPTYFASLFKRATGTSPYQYVIQQRVKRAESLLLKTDLAIADIALQVGFSSQSHLTRQFKRFTGMTPKQVR